MSSGPRVLPFADGCAHVCDARVVGASAALVHAEQAPVPGSRAFAHEFWVLEAVGGGDAGGEEHRQALAGVVRGVRGGEFGK